MSFLGAHGPFMPESEVTTWFRTSYQAHHGLEPGEIESSYAEALLAVKFAYDKAAAATDGFPDTDSVIDAFEYMEWNGLSGQVKMVLGNGHQAIADIPVGVSKYDPVPGRPTVSDVIYFSAECVNPPPGWKSADWIAAGFPGASCD